MAPVVPVFLVFPEDFPVAGFCSLGGLCFFFAVSEAPGFFTSLFVVAGLLVEDFAFAVVLAVFPVDGFVEEGFSFAPFDGGAVRLAPASFVAFVLFLPFPFVVLGAEDFLRDAFSSWSPFVETGWLAGRSRVSAGSGAGRTVCFFSFA